MMPGNRWNFNFNIRSLNGLQKYLKEQWITYPDIKRPDFHISANEAGEETEGLPIMIGRKY